MNYQKSPTDAALDKIIHALQNLPTWNVYQVVNGVPTPWMEVQGFEVAEELIIRESSIAIQVSSVSVKIMEWGVLAATAQRVWETEQRLERSWKANLLESAIKEDAQKPEKEQRKWTEKLQEALYRDHPEYAVWKEKVERAAFALSCTQAVLEGFRAKKEMLRTAIRPAQEGGYNPHFAAP